MNVELPDGTVIQGVPDGMSKADLTAKLKGNGYDVSKLEAPPQGYLDKVLHNVQTTGQEFNGILGGALKGAAQIGLTIQQPFQAAADYLTGDKGTNLARRASVDDFFNEHFQPNTAGFQAGKLGAEIAGTAGMGPALGSVARALPVLRASPAIANALSSGGLSTGAAPANALARIADVGTRVAGGAATGAASAGLVDPNSAVAGGVIGAALPPILKVAGPAGQLLASGWNAVAGPRTATAAQDLAKALGVATPQQREALIQQLRSAPDLISSPTVAQALQTPEAAILQRVVHDSPGGAALRDTIAAQSAARTSALEGVAPVGATGIGEARNDLGNAIVSRVIPEEKAISKRISAQYRSVDPNQKETINLPVQEMQAAVDRYMGAGTFSSSPDAKTAVQTANALSKPLTPEPASAILGANGLPMRPAAEPVSRAATWDEVGNLRASINKAMRDATISGDRQAVAALTGQKQAIDQAIQRDLSPEAQAAWMEANASHAEKMDRFHTGPQKSIFRTSPNGEPAVQGGEVAAKFWGANRPGLADDVQAFKRLVDEHPAMMGQFKSMVTTEGAATADAAGNLTTKFSKWVDKALPGLREAFKPEEVATLQRIAADIDRHAASVKAGTSLGGSNTYQNAANALSLGMLDNPLLGRAASMVPGVRVVASPALEGLRGYARNAKANRLAEILSNSQRAADALALNPLAPQPPAINPLLYRLAPLLGTDR